jgi:asparagine synthetase B (glutamine-hydrolysing)
MLSGGFDSVPITISASKLIKRLPVSQQSIQCYSWVYDKNKEADERDYIESVVSPRDNLKARFIKSDDSWFDIDQNPDMSITLPFHTPWLANQYAALAHAQSDNVSVLLSGLSGDILYEEDWVAVWELIKAGEFALLNQEIRFLLKNCGGIWLFTKRYLIAPTKLFKLLTPILQKFRLLKQQQAEWLSEYALETLEHVEKHDASDQQVSKNAQHARRPVQYELVVGLLEANDHVGMRAIEASFGIEKRQPFRDADLIEFMLAIPTKYLRKVDQFRAIVKQAFAQDLPKAMLTRNDKADFFATVDQRINRSQQVTSMLEKRDAHWHKYVKKGYVAATTSSTRQSSMINWTCAYYENWCEIYLRR